MQGLLKICVPSTALLSKKQSSTCKKHVSGCFLHAPRSFRTDTDVRESEQKRDLRYTQISTLSSVQGGTLLNKLFSKALELRGTYGIAANKLIGDVQFVIHNS